jgi:hypothetical protein
MLNEVLEPYLHDMPFATLRRFWFYPEGDGRHIHILPQLIVSDKISEYQENWSVNLALWNGFIDHQNLLV